MDWSMILGTAVLCGGFAFCGGIITGTVEDCGGITFSGRTKSIVAAVFGFAGYLISRIWV